MKLKLGNCIEMKLKKTNSRNGTGEFAPNLINSNNNERGFLS